MSNQVQLQADVGALGIHGLGAFSMVLATLSADNIAPMALIQMEKVGSNFKVSGQFATKVPDFLRRFTAQPLGRLAAAIGWRKGDTASLLAETAGGQAAAMLSMVLANLFKTHQCGEILSQLCSRLLPADIAVASVSQLADVTELLAQKLFPLGFGNYLPDQVVRIHKAYRGLDMEPPIDLLDSLTVDAAVDLLSSISEALHDEAKVVRISGTFAMGHILGIVLFMFPHDTVVTVEDIVIHEGERHSIFVELHKDPPGPVTITVENTVDKSGPFHSSIRIDNQRDVELYTQIHYRFAWPGWVAKGIHLALLEAGSVCTEETLVAFANLLVAMVHAKASGPLYSQRNALPGNQISGLLGPYALLTIERVCQEILQVTPSSYRWDTKTAFPNLVRTIEANLNVSQLCSCTTKICVLEEGWTEARNKSKRNCRVYRMWTQIGQLLGVGLLCFLIHARQNATMDFSRATYGHNIAQEIIHSGLSMDRPYYVSSQSVFRDVMKLVGRTSSDSILACSYGSTIYPTVFETLQIPSTAVASFELLDGKLMFEERYYETLSSASTKVRPSAKKSIARERSGIKPSSLGEHSSLLMTIRETASSLEVRTTVRYAGTNINLGLSDIIQASLSLERTPACSHPSTDPLKDATCEIFLTSVSAPRSSKRGSMAVAMTQSNPTAQLLCCEPGVRSVLMQDSCLDCAVIEAVENSYDVIIVS
ncbi:hypothetical protein BKA66DRAFT_453754 [Pyrenochaeta sp. MPI-SDFR-AT-0127]|nr:hypothetical protein BKA66DRAFT_453754 [Pyrenochaeta sp. MPI-SDFR-AT-0127]